MYLRHTMWHETPVVALGVRLKGGKAGGREGGRLKGPMVERWAHPPRLPTFRVTILILPAFVPSTLPPFSLPAFPPFGLSL